MINPNKIIKKGYPYLITFFLGSIFATLIYIARFSRPEMLRELIFYMESGEVYDFFSMFITLDILMIFGITFIYLIFKLINKRRKTLNEQNDN